MIFLITICVCFIAIVTARHLFPLPSNEGRINTTALPADSSTVLGNAVTALSNQNAGMTGIEPLSFGSDAYAARMALVAGAQSSIDVQYYIWHKDLTGTLLLNALRKAAERGVRVRLLLDDNGTKDLDAELTALNSLPNMEVRLFNPFTLRSPKILSYLFDFFRLNHRMHNKTFTVDNVVAVIGGRNIGDEYFGTGEQSLFVDLDVLAVGKAVPEISADFDNYWQSVSSYPIDRLVTPSAAGLDSLQKLIEKFSTSKQFFEYEEILRNSKIYSQLLNKAISFEWTNVTLISDDPVKALGNASRDKLMITRLWDFLGSPKKSLDLVSPYFVPGAEGTEKFSGLAKNGVNVRILTNSFQATDVAAVHAGYVKYRKDLLSSDVKLYELKSSVTPSKGKIELGITGSSGSSLHAKTFAVDGKLLFVGSFNFDPRSALLNTEMGLLIESKELVATMTSAFENKLPQVSYRPELNKSTNQISWVEGAYPEATKTSETEPGTTIFSRALVTFIGWLPIEWLL